jgi:predicted nucleic acid-binding protein
LLSEDFQAGEKFGDLTVLNPFRTAPGEFLLTG